MAHIDVQQGIEVQLSRQQLSGIRPPIIPQYKGGGFSAVSCLNGVLMGLTLLLLFFMQLTHGSSAPCIEFPRAAAEHTIQAGGRTFACHHAGAGPGNYHSCRGGATGETCWSCADLDTSTPNGEPFFLQPISSYGRLQASLGGDVALREFSLGQFKDWPSYQFRKRKIGLIDSHSAEDRRRDVGLGVGEQHWTLVDIASVCSRDPAPSSSVSPPGGSPDGVQLDPRNLQLQVASWSWRCNSTVVATAASGAAEPAAARATDSTDSATASSDLGITTTTISVQMEMQIRRSDPWLLQILLAVDEKLHESSCDDNLDGPQSVAATGLMGRRVLISDSWKPVIVADSVVVGIGFLLALSALSCWVLQQRRTVKFYTEANNNGMPSSAIARGRHASRESPRRGSRVSEADQVSRSGSGDDGRGWSAGASGGWSQVREGPGRWVQIGGEVPNGGLAGADERSGTVARVPEHGVPSGGLSGVDERSGPEPRVVEEGEEVVAEGPATELRVAEEGQRNGSHVAEEGSGEGAPVTAEGPQVRSGEREGEETTATAHRSSPTAGYRVEPFCFRGLSIATGGFDDSNKLGEGSFGTVYRGLLFGGRVVAIKRAVRNNMQKLVDVQSSFKAEIEVLSRLHHKHLVNLVGYCDECSEMMLVYEYMPNGTLTDHIHNRRFQSRALSSWKVRIKVALQAARGIEYLHTYAEPPVIHRDIKSSNILLDSNGSARVSDFGLCLNFPSSSDDEEEVDAEMGHSSRVLQHLTTKAAGTIGYMDPEYYRHRYLTTKSDVYSFGVVMLELLTGKKAIFRRNDAHVSIIDYAVPAMEADDLASILDPRVQAPNRREFLAIEVMAEVGRQAVRLRGKDRPSMTEIIRRLEDAVTLCRPRHAPLSSFGVQIGSSSEASPSPRSLPSGEPSAGPSTTDPLRAAIRSDPAASASLCQFVEGVGEGDEEEDEGPSGTDIAQVGSLSSTQVLILEEFLHEIHPNGSGNEDDEDNNFDHYLSHVDIQFCSDSADPEQQLLRRRASAAGAPGPSEPGPSNINVIQDPAAQGLTSSSAMAAKVPLNGSQGGGERQEWLRPHSSSLWQQAALLQELQESSRGQSQSSSSTGEFDTTSRAFDNSLQRQRGSYYSCEGGSAGASAMELPLDYYSAVVVDDPLLDQRTSVMAGFSNFSDVGPPVDLNPPSPGPPPPLLLSQEQQELGSQLVRAAHGFREPGYQHESEPSDRRGPGLLGSASGGLDKGKELERTPDELIGDIDIQEFLGAQYSELERAGDQTAYAGFSNFSVLHDLDELMKALHSLHAKQEQKEQVQLVEQEELDELREQQQPDDSSASSTKG